MGPARSTASGLAVAALVVLGGLATPAAASVSSSLPHLGVIPTGRAAATPSPHGFAVPKGFQSTTGMTYHGGSGMRTNTVHAIYWVGRGSNNFPSNYESIVNVYFAHVAHDSGT